MRLGRCRSSKLLLSISCLVFWSIAAYASLDFDWSEENKNLTGHLARKRRQVKEEIAKEYAKAEYESVVALSYDVKWERLESERLNFSEPRLAIRIFDKMFILEGNRAMSVDVKSAPTNDTSSAVLPAIMRPGRAIKFAKSIVWKSRLYLLVCEEDDCTLYIGENASRMEHEQTLDHRGTFDATFFTRDNQLYLVVTHDKSDEFFGSSTIYCWTGTYMDVIQPIETSGDVSVIAFNYGRSTIMAFARPGSDQDLEIYEFVNGRIERIQYLPISRPISIVHYRHEAHDFLLIVNERQASSVYWWDGYEFLHWIELSDIVAPRRINVVQLSGDMLFFVSHEKSVSLYKVTRLRYTRLDILDLKDTGERVIDTEVLIDEATNSLTLLLVTLEPRNNLYRVEPWKLIVKKNRKDNAVDAQEAADATEECLSDLLEALDERMISLDNLTSRVWPTLLASENDSTYMGSLVVRDLILEDSAEGDNPLEIERIVVETLENDGDSSLPNETSTLVAVAAKLVASVLDDSRKLLRADSGGDVRLTGDARIEGDAEFRDLRADSLRADFLDGRLINFENYPVTVVSATRNQMFVNSRLRGKNITVERLEIDSLCGIPREYWLRRENEESNIFSSYNLTDVFLENDTIVVKSARDELTTFLRDLETSTIDGIDLTNMLDNVFVSGGEQVIKGNIFQSNDSRAATINVVNLVAKKLNGIAAERLITRATDQNLTGSVFCAGRMLMRNAVVERINGIPVSEFAMVAKKNRFAGEVTVARLKVLEDFVIEDERNFSLINPLQYYKNVTVLGDVRVSEVEVEPSASISLASMARGLGEYWTKSTHQTFEGNVRFDEGLSVDELTVDFLNDLDPNEDIVLTGASEISSNSLEFKNFTVRLIERIDPNRNDFTANSNRRLYDDTAEALIVNEKIHVERLSVARLYVESFNGVPVDVIVRRRDENSSEPCVYSDSVQTFVTLTVKERLEIEDLHLSFVSESDDPRGPSERRRVDEGFLRFDEDYRIDRLIGDELRLGRIRVNRTDGINVRDLLNYANATRDCYARKSTETSDLCSRIVVEGDASIEKDLEVIVINGKSSASFLDELSTTTGFFVNSNETFRLDELRVRDDLIANSLQGTRLETLLSKSRAQHLGNSKISFFQIFVDDARVRTINGRDTSDFIYVDSPEIRFDGDVVFGNLTVSSGDPTSKPRIRTKYLNGFSTSDNELYEKLGNVSSALVGNLRVRGNASWLRNAENAEDTENSPKLGTILRHALPRNATSLFVITTNGNASTMIESSGGVFVTAMRSRVPSMGVTETETTLDVEKILKDSVLDVPHSSRESDNDEILVEGEKIFGDDIRCARLFVSGEIDVTYLETARIDDLASMVVRVGASKRDAASSVRLNATMIFRNGLTARNLVIRRSNGENFSSFPLLVHGLPIDGIFATTSSGDRKYDDSLPDSTYLESLVVLGDASIVSFDSVNIDEFARERIALDSKVPIIVHGNLRFNGLVRVSGNASVVTLNGIAPADLVLNESTEDQTIHGRKTLASGDFVIRGETRAPLVAGVDLREAYDNAVLNNEPSEIFGDVIFQADVGRSSDHFGTSSPKGAIPVRNNEATNGGFTNGMRLRSFIDARDRLDDENLRVIAQRESLLEARIGDISNVHLPVILRYFEDEKNFTMIEAANVTRVRVTRIDDVTLLSLYTEEAGSSCGLTNDDDDECSCRGQHIVEIKSGVGGDDDHDECHAWRVRGSRVFFHHRDEARADFAINVATTSVSRNERCVSYVDGTSMTEFTTISWMTNARESVFLHRRDATSDREMPRGTNETGSFIEIRGYLSDAFVFTQNDLVYVILAMYYDPIRSTHHTDSLVYALDLASNALRLHQRIPTSHAVGLHAFDIPGKGRHIFIASHANGKTTESVLYRFESVAGQFRLLRSFPSGGNRHGKSVSLSDNVFLILDDAATNSINVYRHESKWDNFYHYQSIYHDSMARITSIETFYTGEFHQSRAYVMVTTAGDRFFVYEYSYASKFQLVMEKRVKGIMSMFPFDVGDRRYVFVGTDTNSTILRIVEQGGASGMA